MALTVTGPTSDTHRWSIVVDGRSDLDLRRALAEALDGRAHDPVQLWIRNVDPTAHTIAVDLGFTPYRDLWQLRCPLPAAPSGLTTRAITPSDLDDFIRVNNRAFAWHPEQSGMTRAEVEQRMGEPWFDPDGFRLLHDGDDLVGFCWTKIHPATDHEPVLGEIYVIAIDPDHHGKGLGKPMTLAGLEWLAAREVEHGMLYVESDNDAANATYRSIGFVHHHTDRAYERLP